MADTERVVSFLGEEFGWDDLIKQLCRDSIGRAFMTGSRLEFICDDAVSANFRLKRSEGGGLRMAYYGRSHTGQERADRLTRELEALDG